MKTTSLKTIAATVFMSCAGAVALAQAPAVQWDKTFGGSDNDRLSYSSTNR